MADADPPLIEPMQTPSVEEPASPTGDRSHRSALFIVFLVVFIDLLGFGIVLPLLPLFATELLEPLYPGDAWVTKVLRGVMLGLLMSSFSAMQFIFAPIWGLVSDRIGRRPIILLGLAGSVVFYSLFGVASEIGIHRKALVLGLILMFIARLGAGVAGATISTAQAVIADSTGLERRARGMALIGAAFGMGFTFGPLLGFGSLFVDVEGMPGFMAAGLSLAALLLAMFLLPETLHTGSMRVHRRWLDWGGVQVVLRTPSVGILVGIFFLATLAFGSLESTLALMNKFLLHPEADMTELKVTLTREALKTTERNNFLIFAFVGFVLLLAQGLLYRRLVARVGEVRFMKAGWLLMTVGLACVIFVALAVSGDWFASKGLLWSVALVVLTILVTGFAFMTPSVQSLISKRSDPARQGEVLGVNQSASALARISGPMIAPPLFYIGQAHIWPYVFGTILLTLVCFGMWRVRQD